MNQESVKVLVGTVSGLVIGGLAGYYISKRVLSNKFDTLLDEEVAKVKIFYKEMAEGEPEDEAPMVEVVLESDDASHEEISRAREEHAKIVSNSYYGTSKPGVVSEVTVEPDPDYDDRIIENPRGFILRRPGEGVGDPDYVPPPYMQGDPIDYKDPEIKEFFATRDTSVPYLITVDEFMDDEESFDKQSVTYFEGDDSLSDDREMLIEDIDMNVGRGNLDNFGLYSRDSDIVYVRNERISVDFEIAFDPRTYVEAVAGFKFRKVLDPKEDD